MVKVMEGLRLRLQLSSFIFLHRDQEWLAACKRIHGFLDSYIDKAYDQLQEEKLGKQACYADGRPRNDFLWTIAGQVPDRLELRTQLTSVWIPSNETTSIFVSNTLFALARHPNVVSRLRQEILDYGDQPLTFTGLRSLTYLRWVLNESKTPTTLIFGCSEILSNACQAIDYILSVFRPFALVSKTRPCRQVAAPTAMHLSFARRVTSYIAIDT